MKILQIIPRLAKGGAERLVLDICRGIHQTNKAEIKLLTFDDINEYSELSSNLNHIVCPSYVIPSISGKTKINIQSFIDTVKQYKPDIIHSHLFEAEIVSREHISTNITYVTHLHDNMKQFKSLCKINPFHKEELTNFFEKRRIIKKYRQCNNHFIAISKDTFQYFNRTLPADLRNIQIISNAIDFDKFYYKVRKKNNARLNLISVGSLVDKKNQIFLIDIVKDLIDKGIDTYLNILGDGPNRLKIQERIDSTGLNENIKIQGNVDCVEEHLKSADIYVHPAIYEPFGLVILEAMASGLPCVTIDGKGNRDIIQNEVNGYILPPNDIEIFVSTIIQLWNNPQKYQEISKISIETAQKYRMDAYSEKLLTYYSSIKKL